MSGLPEIAWRQPATATYPSPGRRLVLELVFTSRYGPTALPVMYKIDGDSIVLGTWDRVFDEDLRTGIAFRPRHGL